MDPNTARQVLRIFPDAPITLELVERAYAAESWARLPSRYTDPAQREQAEAWARTLAFARAVLLQQASAGAGAVGAPVVPATPTRRRLGWLAISGIAVGTLAIVAFITFASIGAVRLVSTTVGSVQQQADSTTVERYQSGETQFDFPAALEYYTDNRYDDLCSDGYASGCWQTALFTEADCGTLEVTVAYSNDAEAWPGDEEATIEIEHVLASEETPVVFGNDDYGYGWVEQVACLDTMS